jgi:hypothetical protein
LDILGEGLLFLIISPLFYFIFFHSELNEYELVGVSFCSEEFGIGGEGRCGNRYICGLIFIFGEAWGFFFFFFDYF